jgi:mono/diheme cytochrome c family protein
MQMLSPDGGQLLRFQDLEDQIFTQSCATSFCHKPDPPPAAPMSLEADKAYMQLVNVEAAQRPAFKRVLPGDPANSWLIIKLRAETATGHGTTRMPLNKPQLTDEQIGQIEDWISRGAPND